MNDSSKLVLLLNSLEASELQELFFWLKSPIHNNSKRLSTLFNFLRKKVWRQNKPFPLLKILKALKIVPKSTTNDDITPKDKQDYRKLASRLTLQIEEYLKWKMFKRKEIDGNILLMTNLLERQLYKTNQALINKTKRLKEQHLLQNIEYCKYDFELAEMEFFLDVILRNRRATGSMENAINSFRVFCIVQLLRFYCAVENSKNILAFESEFPFKQILLDYLKHSNDTQHFTVNIYYRLYLLLENKREEDYYTLKEILFGSLDKFDANTLRQFFAYMSNYCLIMSLNGHTTFIHERFLVYEHGLRLKCWTAGIYFSQHQFIQILNVGLLLDKLEWTKQFYSDYKDRLAPNVAENTQFFCLSKLAFHEKKYQEAQEHLSSITQLEDFYRKLEVKIMLIKIYYDNGDLGFDNFDIHPIHNELEALRINTLKGSGTKIAVQTRIQFSNFAHILKKILAIRRNQLFKRVNSNDITKLKTLLLQTKPITDETWLTSKIDNFVTIKKINT